MLQPCHNKTYDNETLVLRMAEEQRGMKIPTERIPRCPICKKPMVPNLRADDKFVEDDGWHTACKRYAAFEKAHESGKVLYLELGVGANTPGIIKYPFWRRTLENKNAAYACMNAGEAFAPREIADRAIVLNADVGEVLSALL